MAPSRGSPGRRHWSPATLSLLLLPLPARASPAELRLGYLYLQSPSSWVQESFSQFKLGVREVNADPGLLPNHTLTYALADTEGSEMRALDGAVQLLSGARPAHAIVGTGYSSALVAPAVYCSTRGVPIVSPGSTSVADTDKARYPYLLRTVSNDAGILRCAAVLVHAMGWRKAASLTKTSREQGAVQVLHPALKALGVEYLALAYGDITTARGERDLLTSLSLIPRAGFRVVVYHGMTVDMARLGELSTAVGLRTEDYSWVMLEGLVGTWQTGAHVFAVTPSAASGANPVRAAFMARWPNVSTVYDRSVHGAWDPVTKLPFFGANANSEVIWDTDYAPVGDGQPDTWGMIVYDTVWVLAKAFHELLRAGGDPSDGASLKERILAVRHLGVTGELLFDQGSQDRLEPLEVVMANGAPPGVLVGRTTGQFGTGAPGDGSWCLAGDCLSSTEAQISALPWRGGRPATDGRALDAARSDGTVGEVLMEGARVSIAFHARDSFGRPPCLDTCNAAGDAEALCLACRRDLAAYGELRIEARDLAGAPVAPAQPAALSVDALTGRGALELPLGFFGAGLEDRQLDLRLRHRGRTVPMSPEGGKRVTLRSLACPLGMSGPPGQCAQCLPGRFAPQRGMGNCTECGLGAAQDLVGQASCRNCSLGRFAGVRGMSECSACPLGTFGDGVGRGACTRCPLPMTTLLPGSQALVSCVCPAGMYLPLGAAIAQGEAGVPCRACPRGMDCPAGSDAGNFARGPAGAAGAAAPLAPRVQPGHWSSIAEPLAAYKCLGGAQQCPGGAPESCGRRMRDLTCAVCERGYYLQDRVCWDCPGKDVVWLLFPTLILASLAMIPPYYLVTSGRQDDLVWNAGEKSIPTLLAFALYQMQVAGILVTCNLDTLPRGVGTAWSWVNDVLDLLPMACAGLTYFGARMALKLFLPAWCCSCFVLVGLLSKAIGRLAGRQFMDLDVLWGCLGNAFMVFYVSTCFISCSLFRCYGHPNGEMSVQSAPEVLCYKGEWGKMVAGATLAVAVYCGGSLALFVWVLSVAPAHCGEETFNKRWCFLIAKFRARCRWWTVPYLFKGLALNLAQVVAVRGQDQLLLLLVIILSYSVGCNHFKPWRHVDANITDVMLHMVLAIVCAMLFWYALADGDDGGRTHLVDVLVAAPLAVILWFLTSRILRKALAFAGKNHSAGWLGRTFDPVTPGAGTEEANAQDRLRAIAELDPTRAKDVLKFMAEADRRMLLSATCMVKTVQVIRSKTAGVLESLPDDATIDETPSVGSVGKAADDSDSSGEDVYTL